LWLHGGSAAQRQALSRQLELRLFQRGSQVIAVDAPRAEALSGGRSGIALLAWLVETGHLVVADGAAAAPLADGLSAADRWTIDLDGPGVDHGGGPVCSVAVGDLGAEAAAARVVSWLGDCGVFGAPALLSTGAGI
jgi:hypothetical protein